MEAVISNPEGERSRMRVSVIARLVAAMAYTVPLIGGALGSILLMKMFRALRENESAGIIAVMAGMKEASLPVIASLYLAAFLGFVVVVVLVVRMIVQTKTVSPPFWFFILGGVLCFLPAIFFWKAQLLVLEVLSPGSSIGSAGIAGVAAEIGTWLLVSLITAPIVFLILLLVSVVPFSGRPGKKVISLIAATGVTLMFIATAVAIPYLIDGPKRKNEIVSLPANVKNADKDAGIEKESSLVLTLAADGKMYKRQTREVNGRVERSEAAVTDQELPGTIERSMEDKTPDRRIVYFKCDVNASYESVLKIFEAIRKADVDKVGLVVIGQKDPDDPYQTAPLNFEVRLQERIDPGVISKPNPFTLVAAVDKDGKLLLNNEPKGTMPDASRIETTLKNIFKDREDNGIFREGTNEVEKTIHIKASKSTKYGDFIKLVEAVKAARAEPIGIQIDDVN